MYFDGGCRLRAASAVVVVVAGAPVYFKGAPLIGAPNCHRAEANVLRLANLVAASLLENNRALINVKIFGDNHAVILAAAARLENLRAVPGRSACPETWASVARARLALEDAVRQRAGEASFEYVWVPRAYNAYADEVCTATILSRPVSFAGLRLQPPPTVYTNPSPDELLAIAKDAARSAPDNVRSLPAMLAPLWRQVLAVVASWASPAALLLAPRVLLRKDGDLRAKLSRRNYKALRQRRGRRSTRMGKQTPESED